MIASLLAELGSVCSRCSTYNEPSVHTCASCGAPLLVAAWVRGQSAPPTAGTPGPPTKGTSPAPAQRAPPAAAAPLPETRREAPLLYTPGPSAPVLQRVAPATCPSCHATLQGAPLFCPSCGLRLADDARLAARRALSGAPMAMLGSARLVLLRGTERENEAFRLAGERTEVGRTRGALVLSHDPTLAPLAATFVYKEGRLVVIDAGGPSGVYVRIRAPEVVRPGETFAIGDRLVRFSGALPPAANEADGTHGLGTPRPAGATLLRVELVHGGGVAGRAWVRPAPLRMGRAIGDVLFGDDPFISARHCELDPDPGGVLLRDLGSSNGTFVRVPSRTERVLQDGDYVRLGKNILRVEIA